MRRQAAFPITGGLLCLVATTTAAAGTSGPVAPPAGPPLAPRTHQIMLYLSQPMGGSGGAAVSPKFGFRVDQVRMMGQVRMMEMAGAPDAGDPVQRRSLIGWQMDGHSGMHVSDMKLELGGRVTYDVAHGGFGVQSSRPGMAPSASRPLAVSASHTTNRGESKSFELHGLEARDQDFHNPDDAARPFTRDLFHEANGSSSMLHDVTAAAIATFKSSRNVPVQQRLRPSDRP